MRKTAKRRLRWEATQGAERIVLIKEGRLLLDRKVTRVGNAGARRGTDSEANRPR